MVTLKAKAQGEEMPSLQIDEKADAARYGVSDKAPGTDKTTRARTTTRAKSTIETVSLAQIRKSLVDMYHYAATFIALKDMDIANAIVENSEECADSLITLAEKNPAFKRTLSKLVSASAYSGIIAAHAPILMIVAIKYVPALRDMQIPISDDTAVNEMNTAA